MTYDCVICWGVNRAANVQCQYCGTIPADYSIIGKPSRFTEDYQIIEVVSAQGAQHVESRRGRRLYFRTIPLDYFV